MIKEHKAEPQSWRPDPQHPGDLIRQRVCRYCGKDVQRQGFLRRWRHVK